MIFLMAVNRLEQIDRYLDGLLDEQEYQAFEEDLAKDESLREQLNFVQFERKLIATNLRDQKLSRIKELDRAFQQKRRQKRIWYILIASSLAIILLAFLISRINKSSENPNMDTIDKAVAALYTPPASLKDKVDLERRTIDLNEDSLKSLSKPELLYIGAHKAILNGSYNKAIQSFQLLIADVNYGLEAEWFMVLCYYTYYSRSIEIIPEFQSILNDDKHPYYRQAQDLKKIIEGRSK